MGWRSCNTAIGNAATGKQYFRRASVEDNIWQKLRNNQNIRYGAPRRTGKTSILKFMEKNPIPHFKVIYEEIESINTSQEFYVRMIKLISTLLRPNTKLWNNVREYLEILASEGLGLNSKLRTKDEAINQSFLTWYSRSNTAELPMFYSWMNFPIC
ncbi:MAG: hypothetical protein AAGA77_04005 [Bacteroidota bacterium]